MAPEVPLRDSLLLRLLIASFAISLVSIAATAWLTARSTTIAIKQERGQILADDATIQNTLEGFAAVQPNWDEAGRTVRDLARRTGRGIVITTRAREVITASDRSAADRLPLTASAVIDPLNLSPPSEQGAGPPEQVSRIDPRAVGPYLLPAAERKKLRELARQEVACLNGTQGLRTYIVEEPSGRPAIRDLHAGAVTPQACATKELYAPTPTEAKALTELTALVRTCAVRNRIRVEEPLTIDPQFRLGEAGFEQGASALDDCVEEGRREQLAPHVAPAALLFVTSPSQTATPVFDLSRAGTLRVLGTTGLILTVTTAITAVVAIRLIRPLRTLTDAARDPSGRHLRMPLTTKDEISYLAAALNELSERRERTDQQRRVMVSDIAHELRTPLSNIRGWLDAAQDGLADPDSSLVASLQEEAGLLQHIIDDLQVLASADAGSLRLNPRELSLRELAEQSLDAHRTAAQTGRVALTGSFTDDLTIEGDPVRLRQVLGNLLSNAIRHTPPNGSVTVSAHRVEGGVELHVADTGGGIRPEDLPRIFDRFWRAEQSRSRNGGGSGLGLSIVRHLVRAHGGEVYAVSSPGTETVFTVRLPT
ncbi:two-component system histidine kinase [Streptomyces zinciresistens K42]|uniref:histidine kinase n=1 Tax=Streptomyces zinciresistens K42 TaxID=700597 RepID=G2G921_9ACTN|nr:HAMP domain-containing sensor histidine kinase [Streptomyces zinciresistens]EGX59970.1 two-component system histidine kinase [Streptomyces zinciresistens K42]